MEYGNKTQKRNHGQFAKRNILVVIALVVVCVVVTFTLLIMQPERSIANFCQVAKDEKSVLTGDVNYEKRVEAYKKLEAVAPDEIRPDITTIRKGYEAVVQNPSDSLSTGFGIIGAENRRTDFINQNCSDF